MNVGGIKYFSNAQWFLHCWETVPVGMNGWARKIEDFVQSMRQWNISPNQIKNIGTQNLYPTKPLNKEKLETVLDALSIPIIRVLKRYLPRRKDESELRLSHPYIIEIGERSLDCKLKKVPSLLNNLRCRRNDVLFHKELSDPYCYDTLNITDRLYIELHTLFKED